MILVTGGTGLIGSELVWQLVLTGAEVKVLKRASSSLKNIERLFKSNSSLKEKILWEEGDVTDIGALEKAFDGVTHIYHCAALVSMNPKDYRLMMTVNARGTENMVNLSLKYGIKKFCHCSSVAAIGRSEENKEITEETTWKNSDNNSSYAISKYAAEREVWRGIAEGLNGIIVNPTVVIGPGNWQHDSSALIGMLWRRLKFYSEGVTGFVDVRDVAKAMIKLMNSDKNGERYILTSENKSYREFFFTLADIMKKKKPGIKVTPLVAQLAWRMESIRSMITGKKQLITRDSARNSVRKYFYSNEKIKSALGFNFIPVEDALRRTAQIFLEEHR